jgi:centromere/kinetochore protein ZW10
MSAGHNLMMEDLSQSLLVCADYPLGRPNLGGHIAASEERQEFVCKCRREAGTVSYRLPTCHVSVSICRFICLAYDTLREALDASQQGTVILYTALHDVIELLCDVIPFYHSEQLNTSSLHAALHHNNCMFIAHHLITIDKLFRHKLTVAAATGQDMMAQDSSVSVGGVQSIRSTAGTGSSAGGVGSKLVELVAMVKRLGNDNFTQHIVRKKHELCQLLLTAKGFMCVADDNGAKASQAISNVLTDLRQLAGVWSNILPTNAFCHSLGSLLSCVLREIISNILAVTEFSIDDCSCLQRVLTVVLTEATDMFHTDFGCQGNTFNNSAEVTLQECVPTWMKYRELVALFGLGLADVRDRWADGKGPLAMHMTGSEVARLVVAVFERTSRRDQLIDELLHKPSVHILM